MRGFERSENGCQHALRIGKNFAVPEPQNTKPLSNQKSISCQIGSAFNVTRAIGLDNQPFFKTYEIDNVGIDPNLPSKLPLTKPSGTQEIP